MDATNAALLARRLAAIPRALTHATPAFAQRARNAEIWDVEGRRYIDFAGGIGVLNTGHCHPRVMAAATEQMNRFTHTCVQVMAYEPYIALAERLNATRRAAATKATQHTSPARKSGAGCGRYLRRWLRAARQPASCLLISR